MGNHNKAHSPFGWLHVAKIYAPAVALLFSRSSPGHASRLKWMTAGRFVSWCHWRRDGTRSVSSVIHRAWRCCLGRWLHALSRLAKHSGDPKWTAFVQQSQRYSPSCAALNCDSKVRHYSYGWHEVSLPLGCVAQQLLTRAWLELSVCTCLTVWLYACMAVWACAVTVNCSMCPLDLRVELCGLVPVRQNTEHALTLHACHNERTLAGLFMCHVYSRVQAS